MEAVKISVETLVNAPVEKVWDAWNDPIDITKWNQASPDWHCPHAENDLRVGGKLKSRMEAKDGSFGFDFEAVYDEVVEHKKITYTMGDGRQATSSFEKLDNDTKVTTVFDAETENSVELQQNGWQAILNSFKQYVESRKELHFSIDIHAGKQKVWETMLQPDTYKIWTNAAWPGSRYDGEWKQGARIKFMGEEDAGTLALIEVCNPYDYLFARHVALINSDGSLDTSSEMAKEWTGAKEAYQFSEADGITSLKVFIETNEKWANMFEEGWPVALQKLKELCENK